MLQSNKDFFRSSRYIIFWISSLLSNIGSWMQQVAQPWVVLNLSNSPFWVGLDGFALNAPGWLFTLWGGVLADRYDRKKVVLFFQGLQFLCIVAMFILLLGGWLKVWMVVSISFLVGLTDSLSNPAFQTIVPSLVSREDIPRAVSLNSTQFNLSRVLGPAIAGIVIARFGAVTCFGANAASYIPFFISIYFIYPRPKTKILREPVQVRPIEQLREIRQLLLLREVRLPLMTTLVNTFFCGPLIIFCSVLVKSFFHADVGNFGWAMAAFGSGGLIGAASSFFPLRKSFRKNRFASIVAILLGALVAIIAVNRSFYLLILLLVLAGTAFTTSNISINTFLQENAENRFRGRITSLYQLALSGGVSLGALFTGLMVTQLNISTALITNGILAITLQVWILVHQLKATALKAV